MHMILGHMIFSYFYHVDACKCAIAMLPLCKVLENIHKPKTTLLNVTKSKRKQKYSHMQLMVIFDQIIMMPTLSINSHRFLNQTLLSFCIVCKNT